MPRPASGWRAWASIPTRSLTDARASGSVRRAFLDANVLYSASRDARSRLRSLWEAGAEVVTSAYAVEEARRNAENDDHRARLEALLARTRIVPEAPSPDL